MKTKIVKLKKISKLNLAFLLILFLTGILFLSWLFRSSDQKNEVQPKPTELPQRFNLDKTDFTQWHVYKNSQQNLSLLLPPGLDAFVNNPDASGSTPAKGNENYAWLMWNLETEPFSLAEIHLDFETKPENQSLKNFIIQKMNIKDKQIPPSHEAYDLFADTTFNVLEFYQLKIDNHEAWYLSIEPIDEENNNYTHRLGAGEYLWILKDSKNLVSFFASTEFNYQPHSPVLMTIAQTLQFDN